MWPMYPFHHYMRPEKYYYTTRVCGGERESEFSIEELSIQKRRKHRNRQQTTCDFDQIYKTFHVKQHLFFNSKSMHNPQKIKSIIPIKNIYFLGEIMRINRIESKNQHLSIHLQKIINYMFPYIYFRLSNQYLIVYIPTPSL